MDFEHTHFCKSFKPNEVIILLKTLEKLDSPLKRILAEEVARGNKITNVTSQWPHEESIAVSVQLPFRKKYEDASVSYTFLNDPHFGKEFYSSESKKHILLGAFSEP